MTVIARGLMLLALTALSVRAFGDGNSHPDAGWFAAGDVQLRMDLELLNDAEIVRLPVTQWPIPRAAVRLAVEGAREHLAVNAAVVLALERVRARLAPASKTVPRFGARVSAGEAGLWRDFDTISRDSGAIGASVSLDSGRYSAGLVAAVAIDAQDAKDIRPDGSHASVHLGNWLVSAHTLERWWGPSHGSSLILSNNARPMPTIMFERAEARAFETRWLRWLGPWRMSFGISRMEDERADIDAPLFMAWRVVFMPFRDMEVGFSRTAQFCGEQLECNLDVFGNLLAGNDNLGFDATPENEPGNQMAGFDLRWNSPIGNLPYALYGQYIGEDESSYLPAKYLGLLGLQAWKPFADGGILQIHAEYANTTCSGLSRSTPYFDCAYNQGRFSVEGYRYRGRVIGATTDGDAESLVLGAIYSGAPDGSIWTLSARAAQLNHVGVKPDPRNVLSPYPQDYASIEGGWQGKWLGQSLSIQLGMQALEPEDGRRDVEPFGFMSWRYDFGQ